MTKLAADAARAGRCETVEKLDAQVRMTDADFHDTVFVHDVAIVRCLNPAAVDAGVSDPMP